MRRRERVAGLLVLLLVVVGAKLGQQAYRWFAYAEERTQLQAMSARLEEAGLEVVRTQIGADSLRVRIERMDHELGEKKRAIAAYDRHVREGALPAHLYGAYRGELDAYNRGVEERNGIFGSWREVVQRNHAAVGRFNALADSIRALATRIGEPYYRIPSPVETAVERGLIGDGQATRGARR